MISILTPQDIAARLPVRPEDSHKGTFGHLVTLAGSRGFTGAVKLVCNAAYRSGAGLVTAAVPETLGGILAASLVEPMTLWLPATSMDTVAYEALEKILDFVSDKSALVAGPGLSTHPETVRLVRRLFSLCPCPMVVDADGLNALAGDVTSLVPRGSGSDRSEVIFTPHPGEMSRLTGLETAAIQGDRAGITVRYASEWGSVVVLKGHCTIVAAPDGRIQECPTGNNGMATGGTGDVLTGIIGALLAQGLTGFDAACTGVFVHGLAGDIAAAETGVRALIASDIIDALPRAWRQIERTHE